MSSLALLKVKIHLHLYVTGKNSVDWFFADAGLYCGGCLFSFKRSYGSNNNGYNCVILEHEVGIA